MPIFGNQMRKRIFAAVGAAAVCLVLAGTLLPWAKITAPVIGEVTRSGIEGWSDAVGAFVLALLAAGVLAWDFFSTERRPAKSLIVLALGAIIATIAVVDIGDVKQIASEAQLGPEAIASVGEGLYLTLAGGISLGGTGLIVLVSAAMAHQPTSEDSPTDPATEDNSALVHLSVGMLLQSGRRLAEAIPEYDEAIRLNPRYAEAYVSRGLAYIFLRKPTDGKQDIDRAVALGFDLTLLKAQFKKLKTVQASHSRRRE